MNTRQLSNITGLQENVPLAQFSTFKVGGSARYFVSPANVEELAKAFGIIRTSGLPYFILGGGSNILVSDRGFDGVVIKPGNKTITVQGTTIVAEAGAALQQLVQAANKASLSGLEHMMGIPGNVGGALAGNAGTSDKWINQAVRSVTVADRHGNMLTHDRDECNFSYRSSRFKNSSEELILSGEFTLRKGDPVEMKKSILDYAQRRKHQPAGNACAGCVFKNPAQKPAGMLIEEAGLKGKQIGGAKVSEDHGNFIVNTGTATAEHIVMLISFIKQQIRDKYGIQLQEEIKYVGF